MSMVRKMRPSERVIIVDTIGLKVIGSVAMSDRSKSGMLLFDFCKYYKFISNHKLEEYLVEMINKGKRIDVSLLRGDL